MIRKLVPYAIRVRLSLLKRGMRDLAKGYAWSFANSSENTTDLIQALALKQDLKPNDAKKRNLALAIKAIEAVEIKPSEIFSFWKVVGNPSKGRGYVGSRSLVNGQIEDSVGGGLCQLAGLVYYISLQAGLEIIERHNHSIDIYTDETRFTPLGSDATVAYGYKDLRIRNNLKGPIGFKFLMEEKHLSVYVIYTEQIERSKIEFKTKTNKDGIIEVRTIIDGDTIAHSNYRKPLVSV